MMAERCFLWALRVKWRADGIVVELQTMKSSRTSNMCKVSGDQINTVKITFSGFIRCRSSCESQ